MHVIIHAILKSGEAIFMHALLGHEEYSSQIPLVARIFNYVRPHGPSALGQHAGELAVPTGFDLANAGAFPRLTVMWKQLEDGQLVFDLENDFLYNARAHYSGVGATVARIPADQIYTSAVRLAVLLPRVASEQVGLFASLNFSGFQAVIEECCEYHQEAQFLGSTGTGLVMRNYIMGVLTEASARLSSGLKRGDPSFYVGGNLVTSSSPARNTFNNERAKLPNLVRFKSSLAWLGCSASVCLAAHIIPDNLRPVKGQGSRVTEATDMPRPAGQGATKKEKVEKTKGAPPDIGSRSHIFVVNKKVGFYKFNGKANENYSITEFAKVAPVGACAPTFLSKGDSGWLYCQHQGEAGHTTKDGGAHRIPAGWKTRFLKLLIVASAAPSNGAILGKAPQVGAALVVAPRVAPIATAWRCTAHLFAPPAEGTSLGATVARAAGGDKLYGARPIDGGTLDGVRPAARSLGGIVELVAEGDDLDRARPVDRSARTGDGCDGARPVDRSLGAAVDHSLGAAVARTADGNELGGARRVTFLLGAAVAHTVNGGKCGLMLNGVKSVAAVVPASLNGAKAVAGLTRHARLPQRHEGRRRRRARLAQRRPGRRRRCAHLAQRHQGQRRRRARLERRRSRRARLAQRSRQPPA